MSENTVKLRVVTPEKLVLDEEDLEIVVLFVEDPEDKTISEREEEEAKEERKRNEQGRGGQVGIMFNHASMLVRITTSPVRYTKNGQHYYLAVAGGFVEVRNNVVTILSTGADKVANKDELDVAIKARIQAEEWLREGKVGMVKFDEKMAEAEVKKEIVHMYKDKSGGQK